MTNWVTIKIPEATRDKAQEDSRTYEEIMQAGLDESPIENTNLPEDYAERLEETMNQLSMANDPGTNIGVEGIMQEIKKTQQFAEEAKLNTEEIKDGMGR